MAPREHSRSGPVSGEGARGGAGELRPEDLAAAARAAAEGKTPPAAGEPASFARPGQFTGAAHAPASDVPGAPATPPSGVVVDVADYERAIAERDENFDKLQRMAADFDNFRRRSAREKQDAAAAADAKLLGELLVVLDDLERALDNMVDADEKIAGGIRIVHQRLTTVLDQHGLSPIEAVGAFDPHRHEAVMAQPTAGVEAGTIVQVLQSGWALGDRVLRHSKVIVAE